MVAKLDVAHVAVIYERVSSPGQEENYSLPEQEADGRRACEHAGLTIHRIHNDGAKRSYTLNRPGLNAALDDIRKGNASVIVVGKFDRLSRDQLQSAAFRHMVRQYGGRVLSANEPIPIEDPIIAEKITSDYFFVAELERRNIRMRTQPARKARAHAGKLITAAFPLFGYQWADPTKGERTRYIVNLETAPFVVRIFEDYAHGVPLRTLVLRLQVEGVPTPLSYLASKGQLPKQRSHSGVWRRATIHRMLTNPAYMGKPAAYRNSSTVVEERDEFTGEVRDVRKTHLRSVDDPDYISLPPETCPALIPEELWQAVQVRLERNKVEAARHNPDPERALLRSGHIVCGYCSQTLYTATTSDKYGPRYYCRRRPNTVDVKPEDACVGGAFSIQTDIIDREIWTFMKWLMGRPDVIRDAIDRLKDAREVEDNRAEERLAAYGGVLGQLEEQATNLALAIAQTSVPHARAILQKELDIVAEQLQAIAVARADLGADAVQRLAVGGQIAELEELMERVTTNIERFTYKQKRTLLWALGVRVTMWRKGHKPRYRVRCDFGGLRTGLDTSLLELDDEQIAALVSGIEQPVLLGSQHWVSNDL